nr:unnamed protein product [Callosobruchus chinensis]
MNDQKRIAAAVFIVIYNVPIAKKFSKKIRSKNEWTCARSSAITKHNYPLPQPLFKTLQLQKRTVYPNGKVTDDDTQ